MQTMDGIVILAQETRFQLVDSAGVAHHFVLSHAAKAEPFQLGLLQKRQGRVRVHWHEAPNEIAKVARSIELCAEEAETSVA